MPWFKKQKVPAALYPDGEIPGEQALFLLVATWQMGWHFWPSVRKPQK